MDVYALRRMRPFLLVHLTSILAVFSMFAGFSPFTAGVFVF